MIQILTQKELKKLSKFNYLENEVSRMWKLRTKIVPVTTGALGTIQRGFGNFKLLPGHLSVVELQKIALMSTAHSIR
jgi:hypothetical protein